MNWFKEHKLISILTIILIVLIALFVLTSKLGIGNSTITDGFNQGVQVVSKGMSSVAENIRGTVKGIFKYGDFKAEIDDLTEENEALKKELAEARLTRQELKELQDLSDVLNYEYTEADFDLVSANITSKDNSLWINSFTIGVGLEENVKVNDAVVNGMGLIGKVSDVGKDWAKVLCIIDDDSKESFKVLRDNSIEGIAYGASNGKIAGYLLDAEATIQEGDILITSGLGLYPEGIEIGTVKTIKFNSNTLMKEIEIDAAVDFKSIEKVSVIR